MTPLQRYLAEEIAVDHADGLLLRREALRRLGLLGIGAAAGSALLAACSKDDGGGPSAPSPTASAPASPPAAGTEPITFPGARSKPLQGAWAAAAQPRGSVLVIHENRGLNDHIRSVAGRFAASGYSALAIDLLSDEGGTAAFSDPAEATAALGRIAPERFVADLKAGVDELTRRVAGQKIGAVGFCFGGGMVWLLLTAREPRVAAAAPFYGPLPDNADFTGAAAAVLAVYAEQDARVNASRDAARAALERAKLTHEIVTFPGVNHAFFNDTGPRYNAAAAAQAYRRVIDWFGRHIG